MIIDAVDTVSAKIELVLKAQQNFKHNISSMGAVNKVHPTHFKFSVKNHFALLMIYPSVAEHIEYGHQEQNVNVQLVEIFLEVTPLFLPL